MNTKEITLIATSLFLIAACTGRPYEITTPEKRYQVAEDINPSRGRETWVNTFSVLAPEGHWTFWGPYGSLGVSRGVFRGSPEGVASRYAAYEIRMSMRATDPEKSPLEFEALIKGDFDGYIEKSVQETEKRHASLQTKFSDRGGGIHPRIPDEFSLEMIQVGDMTCRLYEDRKHQFMWTEELRNKGPGTEVYNIGISCPGFFNGGMTSFGSGITVRINNMYKMQGIDIDHKAILEDVKKRALRSLDSVQFDGEFTQSVPDKYLSE